VWLILSAKRPSAQDVPVWPRWRPTTPFADPPFPVRWPACESTFQHKARNAVGVVEGYTGSAICPYDKVTEKRWRRWKEGDDAPVCRADGMSMIVGIKEVSGRLSGGTKWLSWVGIEAREAPMARNTGTQFFLGAFAPHWEAESRRRGNDGIRGRSHPAHDTPAKFLRARPELGCNEEDGRKAPSR
jgi:hypothetical protein